MKRRKKGEEQMPGQDARREASVEEISPAVEGEAPMEPAADDFREKWMRAVAELANLRKRMTREIELSRVRERETVLRGFLEVLDNFDRALGLEKSEGNEWREGFGAIRAQMLETLRRFGAEPFDVIGEPFDPNIHEAIATVNISEKEEGEIVEEAQTGYRFMDGTILRPARVIVVQHG